MKQIVAEGDKRGLILGVHNNRIHVTPPCVISADERPRASRSSTRC
mgnify:FL=1